MLTCTASIKNTCAITLQTKELLGIWLRGRFREKSRPTWHSPCTPAKNGSCSVKQVTQHILGNFLNKSHVSICFNVSNQSCFRNFFGHAHSNSYTQFTHQSRYHGTGRQPKYLTARSALEKRDESGTANKWKKAGRYFSIYGVCHPDCSIKQPTKCMYLYVIYKIQKIWLATNFLAVNLKVGRSGWRANCESLE